MRRQIVALLFAGLTGLWVSPVASTGHASPEETDRTPSAAVAVQRVAIPATGLRDEAAMVLVGTALIGLAARGQAGCLSSTTEQSPGLSRVRCQPFQTSRFSSIHPCFCLRRCARGCFSCAPGCLVSSADRDAQTMGVPAGASLQQAIDRARPGDTLLLAPGAIYTGNFVLPVKAGNRYITIRTAGEGDGLPRIGQRVLPSHAPRLAKLKSPNKEPVLRTAAGRPPLAAAARRVPADGVGLRRHRQAWRRQRRAA